MIVLRIKMFRFDTFELADITVSNSSYESARINVTGFMYELVQLKIMKRKQNG